MQITSLLPVAIALLLPAWPCRRAEAAAVGPPPDNSTASHDKHIDHLSHDNETGHAVNYTGHVHPVNHTAGDELSRREAQPINVASVLLVRCPGTATPAEQWVTFGVAQAEAAGESTTDDPNVWSSFVAVCCPEDYPNLDSVPNSTTNAVMCYNSIYDNPQFGHSAPRVSAVAGQTCQNGAVACLDHPRACCKDV